MRFAVNKPITFEQKFINMISQWNAYQEANEILQSEVAATVEDHTESIHILEQELKSIEKRRSKWQYAWYRACFQMMILKMTLNLRKE
jgi:hypothetical protein